MTARRYCVWTVESALMRTRLERPDKKSLNILTIGLFAIKPRTVDRITLSFHKKACFQKANRLF